MKPTSKLHSNMNGRRIFVLGTDTDVGKTYVCKKLIDEILTKSQKVVYCKPLQTGTLETDSSSIMASFGLREGFRLVSSLYSFDAALSPDQASHLQPDLPEPSAPQIVRFVEEIPCSDDETLIVEGAGGLLVPLNSKNQTWIDVLKGLNFAIILVVKNRVGALNHTSLTIDCLATHQLRPQLIVLNGSEVLMNLDSIKRIHPHIPIANLEWNHASSLELKTPEILTVDRSSVWHPYTQHGLNEIPMVAVRACENHIVTDQGKLFDATGSWWVNNLGHCNPRIGSAISRQQQNLDQVLFAGMTHEPAAKLAAKILKSAGEEWYQRVFFSDNGSTAVEVALKIAFQRWVHRGEAHRRRFLGLSGAYHGDTIGCMAVGATELHRDFTPLFFQCDRLDPVTRHDSRFTNDFASKGKAREAVRSYFAQHAKDCAAVLVEPLVQGAGGMLMHDRSWLEFVCVNAQLHGIPVIFDEVFTGMGRLGSMWAFEQTNVRPDIFCAAKGLTGGSMPFAVTVAREDFFNDFSGNDRSKAFLHGHSFTANPIACAAGLEVFNIYEDEQILLNVKNMEAQYFDWCAQGQSQVFQPRTHGSIFAFDLSPLSNGAQHQESGYFDNSGREFAKRMLKRGVFMRPLGNCVYLTPALNTKPSELAFVLEQIRQALIA